MMALRPFLPVRRSRPWTLAAILAIAAFLTTTLPVRGVTAGPAMEYRIKAAYLFNFTRFIEWPPAAFHADADPFVVAVVDGDPAAVATIRATLEGKTTAAGRRIEVRAFERFGDALAAGEIVYVLKGAHVPRRELLRAGAGRPVLLVGESDQFAEHGGTVNFVVSSDVVRFEINPRRAESAGLKVSGALATVARLVHDAEEE